MYSKEERPIKNTKPALAEVQLGGMKASGGAEPSAKEQVDALRHIIREHGEVLREDGAPLRAPPKRAVMHTIPFTVPERIEKRRITYKFPERFLDAFDKVCDAHVAAGIWIPATAPYADPMIPLMKSDGVTPRPVVDLRRRNLITRKLQMPVVDQDNILNAVAGAKYVTIADIEGAFQQIRIVDEDIPKTAFSTPRGIFFSTAAQQGDCNSTVSLHRAVSEIVRGLKGVHHYADDVYICTETWEEHVSLVKAVLKRFQENEFYLKRKKFRFCTHDRDVLGRKVRPGEISIHPSKAESIQALKRPTNKKELQKVIGTFGFSSRHIPNYAQLLAPLTELTGNVPWNWSQTCEEAFEALKRMVQKNLKLTNIKDDELAPADSKPVHHPDPPAGYAPKNDVPGKYLFLFTDASLTGCGSALCIGENWWTSQLVGLQSRKFSPAQANYPTHEAELQGVFEAFRWFESKLLGRKVIVCTDNQALANFMTAKRLNGRQARIWTYLSSFDFVIEYVKGERNILADLLSRVAEAESGAGSEDLGAMNAGRRTRRKPKRYDDDEPEPASQPKRAPKTAKAAPAESKESAPPKPKASREKHKQERIRKDRAAEEWNVPLPHQLTLDAAHRDEMAVAIAEGYAKSNFFKKIVEAPQDYAGFDVTMQRYGEKDVQLLYREERNGRQMLCVPDVLVRGRSVREIYLEHAHEVLGHPGRRMTHAWLANKVFWPGLARDVELYCKSCPTCIQLKPTNAKPHGKLHTVPPPGRPYERIGVDFQGPLPPSIYGSETVTFLMNCIDTLTGECILIPCADKGLTAKKCADLWFRHVYPQWGVPREIVSDQDVRWRSLFWKSLHASLGTGLSMSTAYHPQSNGRVERMHRDLNQILRQFVDDNQSDWAEAIPFAQFALNSRKGGSSGHSPFEMARIYSPENLPAFAYKGASETADQAIETAYLRLAKAKEAIVTAQIKQTDKANRGRRDDPLSQEDVRLAWNNANKGLGKPPLLWVSTKNLQAVQGRAKKLLPLFIGPFPVLSYSPRTSTYELRLTDRYARRGLPTRYHSSQLRRDFPADHPQWPNRVTNRLRVFPLDALSDVNAEDLLTGDLFPKEVEMKDAPTVAAADEAEKANSDTVDDDPKGSEIAPGTDTAKGSSESDKKADTVKKSEAEKPSRSKGDPRRKKDAKLGNMEIHSEATAESDALAVPTHPDYDPKDKYWGDVFKLSELETVILRHERTKTGVKLFLNSETAGRKNVIIVDFAKQPGRYAKLQKTLAVQNYLANKKVPTLKELVSKNSRSRTTLSELTTRSGHRKEAMATAKLSSSKSRSGILKTSPATRSASSRNSSYKSPSYAPLSPARTNGSGTARRRSCWSCTGASPIANSAPRECRKPTRSTARTPPRSTASSAHSAGLSEFSRSRRDHAREKTLRGGDCNGRSDHSRAARPNRPDKTFPPECRCS